MYSLGEGGNATEERLGQVLKLNIGPRTYMADLVKSEPHPFIRADGVEELSILLERTILRLSGLQEGDAEPRESTSGFSQAQLIGGEPPPVVHRLVGGDGKTTHQVDTTVV